MKGTADSSAAASGRSAKDQTVIEFPDGLPGLGDAHHWELLDNEEVRPLFWLRSLERPGLALLVVDPRLVTSDYEPRLSNAHLARIGFEPEHATLTLVVVAVHEDGRATANLRAPVIVDVETMRGVQAILEDEDMPLRYPLNGASRPDEDGTRRSEPCSSSAERPVSQS
jgi:flagellar assembly factor FliW